MMHRCGEPKPVRTQAQRDASHRYYLHLMGKHPMKYIWLDIMARTGHRGGASPRKLAWYKERGIDICVEWRDFRVFEEWCLKNGWAKGLQLDRLGSTKETFPPAATENVQPLAVTSSNSPYEMTSPSFNVKIP